jgi:hypothetical protein
MDHELARGDARWAILVEDAQRNIIPPLIQERSPINESWRYHTATFLRSATASPIWPAAVPCGFIENTSVTLV